ncbi:restriction endonuclease subunit S [Paenibacillus polymyxa]|uniref:restriction endonuclease subunit S n=1 Tax=Paenibacillus polymyxa TaxID=1406 RepID=UPI0020246787|nr:restriction endonuclease subunit S [Paenibacillus polymyxa]URJ44029.1 restriction endonuclease subunit S [Paenibacillus polymyxa]
MSREQAMIHMLDAASKMQRNVSMILEAKAVEAEKMRNWTLNHLAPSAFETDEEQLGRPLEIHEQMVEMLEGLTRLQTGLCSNLKALLDQDEQQGGGMEGMMGGMGSGDMS